MGLRVTQGMMTTRLLLDLNQQQRRILELQEQLATNQRVNRPSDDPLAARRGINARAEIEQNEQYLTNIGTTAPFIAASETALLTIVDAYQRANELTIQAANNGNPSQRAQIAAELNQILEGVLVQANSQNGDRRLFGGTRTSTVPFVETRGANGEITAVTYAGNDENIEVEIGSGNRVPINVPGNEPFQRDIDLFNMLVTIRDEVRSGANVGGRIDEFQTAQQQLLESISELGATQARLGRVELVLDEVNLQLSAVYSENIDSDFASVTLNLNVRLNSYQAALNAGARAVQPSLLDFIR